MKKGFTLIELLATIIILALIGLIVYPTLNNVISSNRDKLYNKQIEELVRHANTWAVGNSDKIKNDDVYTLTFDEMYKYGLLSSNEVKNPKTNENLPGCMVLTKNEDNYDIQYSDTCNPYPDLKEYFVKDNSGANAPDLLDKMVPIVYTGSKWIATESSQEKWYSYDEKSWANAVVLNEGITKKAGQEVKEDEIALWYVWIPRYKYKLFDVNSEIKEEKVIEVAFESNTATTGTVRCSDAINQTDSNGNVISETCTNAVNGNWYTHPGFTFGNKELTGFWIGKFSVSSNDNTCNNSKDTNEMQANCGKTMKLRIKPNVGMLYYTKMVNYYNSVREMTTYYNISNADSHMIKNMEWGATIYLKQSKYGLGVTDIGKNSYDDRYLSVTTYITGCEAKPNADTCNQYNTELGKTASTTGNIYGVYDMNTYVNTYVMANFAGTNGQFNTTDTPASGDQYKYGFSSAPDAKYYDLYSNYTGSLYVKETYTRGKLGDATKEVVKINTSGSAFQTWYENSCMMPYAINSPWMLRSDFGYISSSNAADRRSTKAILVRS